MCVCRSSTPLSPKVAGPPSKFDFIRKLWQHEDGIEVFVGTDKNIQTHEYILQSTSLFVHNISIISYRYTAIYKTHSTRKVGKKKTCFYLCRPFCVTLLTDAPVRYVLHILRCTPRARKRYDNDKYTHTRYILRTTYFLFFVVYKYLGGSICEDESVEDTIYHRRSSRSRLLCDSRNAPFTSIYGSSESKSWSDPTSTLQKYRCVSWTTACGCRSQST